MKKTFILISTLLLYVSTTAQDLTIYKFSPGYVPVLDGAIDGIWNVISPNQITLQGETNPIDATFYYATWKMGYTDEAFYVLFQIDDDEFCPQNCTGLSDWQSDRAEVFFDVYTEDLEDGRGPTFSYSSTSGPWYGHYCFITPFPTMDDTIPDTGADTVVYNARQWPKPETTLYDYAYTTQGNSWIYELRIPFSSLTADSLPGEAGEAFSAEADIVIGVEINLTDVDPATDGLDGVNTIRKLLTWNGTIPWDYMDNAGHVKLSPNPVATGTCDDAPVAKCKNISVFLDEEGNASINASDIDNYSYDLCGIKNIEIDINEFTCGDIGSNQVTLTVTDSNDVSSQCLSDVDVLDTISPVVDCNALVIFRVGDTLIIPPMNMETGLFSDNCNISRINLSYKLYDIEETTPGSPELVVRDESWNATYCSPEITDISGLDAIINITKESVNLYPNPAGEYLVLDNIQQQEELYIYDIKGNLVLHSDTIHPNTKINIGNLQEGIYFIKAGDKVMKFVKK